MRRQSQIIIITATVTLGVVAGAITAQLFNTKTAYAQAGQRITTESLGITRGQSLVADLSTFPDGSTKLILRDRNGRAGLILAVYDRPDVTRAQIEFYDSRGNKLRTLDAASLSAISSSEAGRSAQSLPPSEVRGIYDQLDKLRDEIAEVRSMVSRP